MSFESGPALQEAPPKKRQKKESVPEMPQEHHEQDFDREREERQERIQRLREEMEEMPGRLPTLDRSQEREMMGLQTKKKFEVKGVKQKPSLWKRFTGFLGL